MFVHGAAATPISLLDALTARTDLEGVRLYHLHTEGTDRFVAPEEQGRLRSISFFVEPNLRPAVNDGRADFMPIGRATALAFARRGERRDRRHLTERGRETARLVEAAGARARFVARDVSKDADVRSAIGKTLEAFGRVDSRGCGSA